MRKRTDIETDGKKVEILQLEVLLDIRELLAKSNPPKRKGRPPKKN